RPLQWPVARKHLFKCVDNAFVQNFWGHMSTSFFEDLLNSISGRGRQILDLSVFGFTQDETIESLSKALLSGRGEASGVAIALQRLNAYKGLDEHRKSEYFEFLAQELSPDPAALAEAARAFLDSQDSETLKKLTRAVESPRLEFLRR